MSERRLCRGPCGEKKPIRDFVKRGEKNGGRRHVCKVCHRASRREWLGARPEQRRRAHAASTAWAVAHPERSMLIQTRHRAKLRGIPFTITVEDIRIPELCPLLGLTLQKGVGAGGHLDTSPSLDRLDPALGYVPGNVWVISQRANRIKGDATAEELESIAAGVRRFRRLRSVA